MERHVHFEPGEYYHVYNRGVDKHKIFLSDGDWKYFQRLLYIRNDADGYIRPDRCKDVPLSEIVINKPLVHIQAYSQLSNHFHLLLSECESGGISTFMRRLLTSYSMYINKKYNRTGPLMCRPFRSKHVGSDDYLRWVISYIHLNPLGLKDSKWEEKGMSDLRKAREFLNEYSYSSYVDYFVSDRDEGSIVDKESLPIYISELEDVHTMLKTFQESMV